jgi:hypothetical protein
MEVLFIDVSFYAFGMLFNTPLSETYTFMLQNEKQFLGSFRYCSHSLDKTVFFKSVWHEKWMNYYN